MLPGQVVEETNDEDEHSVAWTCDAVEVTRSNEWSTDACEAVDCHQYHHPDGDRLDQPPQWQPDIIHWFYK